MASRSGRAVRKSRQVHDYSEDSFQEPNEEPSPTPSSSRSTSNANSANSKARRVKRTKRGPAKKKGKNVPESEASDDEQKKSKKRRREQQLLLQHEQDKLLLPYKIYMSTDSSDSSESSEDEKCDYDVLLEAKKLVMESYTPLFVNHVETMRAFFKDKFQRNLDSCMPVMYKTFDGSEPVCADLRPLPLKQGYDVSMIRNKKLTRMFPCVVKTIPAAVPLPRMRYFVHIERNIKTEDNLRLSHIPYVADDHDSETFCAELKKAYPEGIHGSRRGWGIPISDNLLYKLLKITTPKWEATNHPMEYLYKAIFKLFPNKLTPRQLETAFTTLDLRFNGPEAYVKYKKKQQKDDVYHSIAAMFCIKCKEFHCLLHGMSAEDFRMHRELPESSDDEYSEPCGPNCYLKMPEVQDSFRSVDEENPDKPRIPIRLTLEVPPFEPPVDNLFKKMVNNNRNTVCQMQAMMEIIAPDQPRTCKEIFHMIQVVKPSLRERSPDDILKRKISVRDQQTMFRTFTWVNGRGQVDNSVQPVPCKHEGPCRPRTDCCCGQNNTLCTKYCSCGPDCRMRFPGCRCQPGQCRSKQCQCFFAKWECDPHLCESCNCGGRSFNSAVPLTLADLTDSSDEDGDKKNGDGNGDDNDDDDGNDERSKRKRLRALIHLDERDQPTCSKYLSKQDGKEFFSSAMSTDGDNEDDDQEEIVSIDDDAVVTALMEQIYGRSTNDDSDDTDNDSERNRKSRRARKIKKAKRRSLKKGDKGSDEEDVEFEITDVSPYESDEEQCSNANIQLGNYKRLRIGVSSVSGFGCFISESAAPGDFIAEYTGEVISRWEAERRGRIYDEFKCSFIFSLNKEQSVDATRIGNRIRFANHSDQGCNCYSQIILVNGEHRIGIFAKRSIRPGEELFFDYQYNKKWKEKYVPVAVAE